MWAVGLCLASLGGLLLRRIAPEKGTGKMFRVLLSAFFICVLISPLTALLRFSPTLSLESLPPDVHNALLEETVTRQLCETVESAAGEVAKGVLSESGIVAEKIEVTTDIGTDSRIYISRIVVTLSKESRGTAATAREKLENRFETAVTVKEADE